MMIAARLFYPLPIIVRMGTFAIGLASGAPRPYMTQLNPFLKSPYVFGSDLLGNRSTRQNHPGKIPPNLIRLVVPPLLP